MGWQHHPFLVGRPKTVEAGVLQPHPYCLQNYPSYPWGPWSFFVAYSPSEELTRLPPIPNLASSSLGWAWPTGQDQWELAEEESLGVVFWGPFLSFPLCSCWLAGLLDQVVFSDPFVLPLLRTRGPIE